MLLLAALGCCDLAQEAEPKSNATSDTFHLYCGEFVLSDPWRIDHKEVLKGRADAGWIKFDGDTVAYLLRDYSLILERDSNAVFDTILEDTIETVVLSWYMVNAEQRIVLRDIEKGESGASHYYFYGIVYPSFTWEEKLIELYYKIKRQVLLNNLSSEEFVQKQALKRKK